MVDRQQDLGKSQLPRGCSEAKPFGLRARIGDRLPKGVSWEEWSMHWQAREEAAKFTFTQLARHILSSEIAPSFSEMLSAKDENTQLTNKVLFARGIQDMQVGRLVVTTNNRMGIGTDKKVLGVGGELNFKLHRGTVFTGERRAQGNIIGLVLNAESTLVDLHVGKKNGYVDIDFEQLASLTTAVISAEKMLIYYEDKDKSHLMSQGELDAAIDWVMGRK